MAGKGKKVTIYRIYPNGQKDKGDNKYLSKEDAIMAATKTGIKTPNLYIVIAKKDYTMNSNGSWIEDRWSFEDLGRVVDGRTWNTTKSIKALNGWYFRDKNGSYYRIKYGKLAGRITQKELEE